MYKLSRRLFFIFYCSYIIF